MFSFSIDNVKNPTSTKQTDSFTFNITDSNEFYIEKYYNPTILEYILNGIDIFKNIIFSLFGESVNKLISLFDGTITIIKEYLLNGYEMGRREFIDVILLGIGTYIRSFLPKLSFFDGNKINNFKYKIVVNNNSKKIKLVKLKTNSLKSIKINSKRSSKINSKRSSKINSKRSSKKK